MVSVRCLEGVVERVWKVIGRSHEGIGMVFRRSQDGVWNGP